MNNCIFETFKIEESTYLFMNLIYNITISGNGIH